MKAAITCGLVLLFVLLGALAAAPTAYAGGYAYGVSTDSDESKDVSSVEDVEERLLGSVAYASDCTAGHKRFLDKMMLYGRVAAVSGAFKACVSARVLNQASAGNYMQCTGDPFYGASRQDQLLAVLRKTRSFNPLTMHCTGGSGNASTGIGSYDQLEEEFNWSGWLNNVYQATPPATDPTWPIWQAAGITWHEVMHQYGYGHGEGKPEECGYTGSSGFNFQSNTMPYLVDNCLGSTITESGNKCGADMATACGPNALKMVTALGGSSCECVRDPQAHEEVAGFVWSQNYTGTFTATPSYSYNSSGASNTVTWLATGSYRVDFPGLGTSATARGNAQVTAYGSSNEYCNAVSWSSSGSTLQLFVKCYDQNGNLADARFTANYVRHQGLLPSIEGGYVLADQPSTSSYTPSSDYQWSSSGPKATVKRRGVGIYSVYFPELTFGNGNVQVTAFDTSKRCKVESWYPEGVSQRVNVRCFGATGTPEDRKFSLALNNHGLNTTNTFAYAWANQPTTGTYTPSTTYQFGSIRGGIDRLNLPPQTPITITRAGTGLYDVMLPDVFGAFPTKTHYSVTAYGSGSEHCKIQYWSAHSVRVACYNTAGTAADARFSLLHLSDLLLIR